MRKVVSRSATLVALGLLAAAGCHISGKDPEPFDPRAAQQNERAAAHDAALRPVRPLPTTLESPYDDASTEPATQQTKSVPATGPAIETSPSIRLTLREIVQRAVANNMDVRVAGYQPAIDETRVTEAQARFDPTFFTNLTYQDQTVLSPSTNNVNLQPGDAIIFRGWTGDVGVRQDLETGGKLEVKYSTALTQRSPGSVGLGQTIQPNPFWTSELALQLTQPLLRDFGYQLNQARISIARNNQAISLLDFRDSLEKTLRDIEDSYWQLVQAEGEVSIADQLLSETLTTADLLIKRKGQDVTRVQISQTNSFVETRRAALIRARSRVRDFSDQLKGLMNDPTLPVSSATVVLPATVPLEEQIRMNLEDLISTGLENRFELGQQLLRMDSANIATKVAKNNLLPQLNLVGSVGVEGLDANWPSALDNMDTGDHISWSAGLQFELPFGNRAARAIWKRTLLQRQQAVAQYQALIDKTSLEIKQSLRDVETSWEEMYATRMARFAASDALRAIQQREEGGEALTYSFVDLKLTTQQRLAEAATAEVTSISNYNRALSRLEFVKGTLLRYNNVVMEEAPLVKY